MPEHDETTLPIHPFTGLQAVGIVAGRPVWPIRGGSPEDGGDAGGDDGGDEGGDDGGDANASTSRFRPITTQEDLDRVLHKRLQQQQRALLGGRTPEEVQAAFDRIGALESDLMSEADKQARQAAQDAFTAAMSQSVPRVVRSEFRVAAAAAGLPNDQLEALLEDVDLLRYADDDGEPDVERIASKVARFAPKKQREPFPDLGAGNRGSSAQTLNMNDLIRRQAGVLS